MFVELPNGELVNTDHIARMVPLTSGATRVTYTSGEYVDYPEDFSTLIADGVSGYFLDSPWEPSPREARDSPRSSAASPKRKAKPKTS
jgi:hypothetical protein